MHDPSDGLEALARAESGLAQQTATADARGTAFSLQSLLRNALQKLLKYSR